MVHIGRTTLHFNDPIGGFPQESLHLEEAMIRLIDRATHNLHIVSFSLPAYSPRWYLHGAVDRAAKRGVKIKIHAHKYSEVNELLGRLRDFRPEPEGWHYVPDTGEENDTSEGKSTGLFHIKAIMVDGNKIYIGSANLSQNAVKENSEWGLVSESPEMCMQLEQYLRHLETKGNFQRVLR